jgi:hypothetical protein
MVAMQAWQTRCSVDKGLNGTGDAGDVTTPSGKSVWVSTPSSGDTTADNANQGIYDMGGMGFASTCPLHDLTVPISAPLVGERTFVVPFALGCAPGGWLKAIIIGFALFYAAKITVGGTS